MAVNKIIYNGETLVDLTSDTVTADDLAAGVTATGADGKPLVGLLPKVTIDAELSSTSTNPVQNKVIKVALDGKLGKNDTAAAAIKDDAGNNIADTYASKAVVSALMSTKLGVISTAYAATRDGAGNNIADTYAKKSDINGVVKSVNGVQPDTNGNVSITVTLPTASNTVMGGVKIGSNISVSGGVISLTRANVTGALGYTPPVSDTTYANATASAAGLMSSSDKSKLDSIAANANNYIHPASHPASMITGLAAVATSGSYNDLSDSPAIPVVDDSLSSDSTNAVQNKVVYGLGQKFFNQLSALASVARTGSYSDLTGTPGNATTSAAGLMSAADKAKLDKVDADAGSVKLITYS